MYFCLCASVPLREGSWTLLWNCFSNDSKVCRYAALACVYMGRRLANGEFEFECDDDRIVDFATCIELILAAINEDKADAE